MEFKIGMCKNLSDENIENVSRQLLSEKLDALNIARDFIVCLHGPFPYLNGATNPHKSVVWHVNIDEPELNVEEFFAELKSIHDFIVVDMDKSFHQ